MTIELSGLALCLAGGGLLAVIAGLFLLVMYGFDPRWNTEAIISIGTIVGVLGALTCVVGVGGQVFLWLSALLN